MEGRFLYQAGDPAPDYVLDALDQKVHIGDHVVHISSYGNNIYHGIYKVVSILTQNFQGAPYVSHGGTPYVKLYCEPIKSKTAWGHNRMRMKYVENMDRIIKLDPNQLSEVL